MAKDPAFLFYPNDYIGGTMGMTFEEKGAYIELLMLQFNRGHMTSQMVGQTVGQLWVKIQDKFKIDDKGSYYNERLELEIEKRKTFVQSRFNNLLGKNQYTKREGHKGGHMTDHMENENENENKDIISRRINVPFETFWNLYDKKEDRIKCEGKWNKLTLKEQEKCIANLPNYILSTPDKQFRKNPATYLNNKSWENEISNSKVDDDLEYKLLKEKLYGKPV